MVVLVLIEVVGPNADPSDNQSDPVIEKVFRIFKTLLVVFLLQGLGRLHGLGNLQVDRLLVLLETGEDVAVGLRFRDDGPHIEIVTGTHRGVFGEAPEEKALVSGEVLLRKEGQVPVRKVSLKIAFLIATSAVHL
jgi:hypothetical protein